MAKMVNSADDMLRSNYNRASAMWRRWEIAPRNRDVAQIERRVHKLSGNGNSADEMRRKWTSHCGDAAHMVCSAHKCRSMGCLTHKWK